MPNNNNQTDIPTATNPYAAAREQVRQFVVGYRNVDKLFYINEQAAKVRSDFICSRPELREVLAATTTLVDLTAGSGSLAVGLLEELASKDTVGIRTILNDFHFAGAENVEGTPREGKPYANSALGPFLPNCSVRNDNAASLHACTLAEQATVAVSTDPVDAAPNTEFWSGVVSDVVLFDPQVGGTESNPTAEYPRTKESIESTFKFIQSLIPTRGILVFTAKPWKAFTEKALLALLAPRTVASWKLTGLTGFKPKEGGKAELRAVNADDMYVFLLGPEDTSRSDPPTLSKFKLKKVGKAYEYEAVTEAVAPEEATSQLDSTNRVFTKSLKQLSEELRDSLAVALPMLLALTEQSQVNSSKVSLHLSGNLPALDGTLRNGVPLNALLKGVPGTGKSTLVNAWIRALGLPAPAVDNANDLGSCTAVIPSDIRPSKVQQVLRVNVHSASSNASLMQGIGVQATRGQIEYREKFGLVLMHILNAIAFPGYPFVLVLEEVQENALNSLIGDLIYLIEPSKRTDVRALFAGSALEGEFSSHFKLVDKILEIAARERGVQPPTVALPVLIEAGAFSEGRRLFVPANYHVFCTSNYRDDRKVVEDNILRRFEVIDLQPIYASARAPSLELTFLEKLNREIMKSVRDRAHPDRYLIGHANWIGATSKGSFARALLKALVELKDIRELSVDEIGGIVDAIRPDLLHGVQLSGRGSDYQALVQSLQEQAGYLLAS